MRLVRCALLTSSVLLVAACASAGSSSSSSSSAPSSAGSGTTARATAAVGSTGSSVPAASGDARGGVPPGYPLTTDVVAPLIITTVAPDPIPVTGTDGKVHVVYELQVLNFSPRPATVTKVDTLADGPDGAVVATLGPDQVTARSLLLAAFGSPATPIPTGRTGVLLLDDTFATRADVPARLTHRLEARFSPAGASEPAEVQAIAARYPDTASQVGGPVQVSGQQPVVVGPPLSGAGWVAGNGCCGLTSHRGAMLAAGGRLNSGERFAVDWVRMDLADDPLRTRRGDIAKNESYLAYGADILAVADGTVVSVVDDMANEPPQQAPTDIGLDQLGGNHIIVDIGGGNYAFFAHLIPGSATVQVGDRVTRGQVIGHVGNTGNTTEPHLHFHISRAPVPLAGDNVPYEIDRFTFVGSVGADVRLVRGPDAGSRTDQLPLEGAIADFPR